MERESAQGSNHETTSPAAASSIGDVQAWMGAWPGQRQLLQRLIRERAQVDPAYSWLGADRELQLMDDVLQRLGTIVTTLSKPVAKPER